MRQPGVWLVAIVAVVAAILGGCKSSKKACGSARDDVVACIDGTPLLAAEVKQLTRRQFWVDGSARLPDPRRQAVEEASRLVLFANEARRLSLSVPKTSQAEPSQLVALLARAFIDEQVRRDKLRPEDFAAEEVERAIADHPDWYRVIEAIELCGIAAKDPQRAEQLYKRASTASAEEFRALATADSEHPASRAKRGSLGPPQETDEWMQRTIVLEREHRAGRVFGPVRETDGFYWIIRVDDVKFGDFRKNVSAEERIRRTRNWLSSTRSDEMVKAQFARLRGSARIETYDDALAKVELHNRVELFEHPVYGFLPDALKESVASSPSLAPSAP
jgi:hypothetical protein